MKNLTKNLFTLGFSLMILTTVGCHKEQNPGPTNSGNNSNEPSQCSSEAECKSYSAEVLGRMAYKGGVGVCTASNFLNTNSEAGVYVDGQLVTEVSGGLTNDSTTIFLPTDLADPTAVLYPSAVGNAIHRMLYNGECFYPTAQKSETDTQLFLDATRSKLGLCTILFRDAAKSKASILVSGTPFLVYTNNSYGSTNLNNDLSSEYLANAALDLGVLVDAGVCDTPHLELYSAAKTHTFATRPDVKLNAVNKPLN